MIERPNVDALMAGELGQWLQDQAPVRERAKTKTWNRRFIVLVVLLPLAIFVLIAFQIDFAPVAWGSFVLGGLGFAWAQRPVSKAVKTVKIGINEAIADALGLEYRHDCEPGAPFELAKSCKLLPNYDRASFEDHWSGNIGDIPFTLHEARLEERRGSGKNKRWVTVFRGIVMSVGYSRRFHGTTLLVRDNAFRHFYGAKKDTIEVIGKHLDYAEMTHPDFEDKFDIFTSDQTEARHLIDPLYVERLIAVEQSYRGDDVATIFHEGSLVVTLKTGDMFESGHIDARHDRQRMETTIDQFARIADLARELNSREPVTGYR
ncbi:DUF3137 domain-containing protein [Aurantiacibacter poecillastricola]|uniref:DUF3137 domain-containing protein n=1 Tax=Aurantiacibacter poecillastricola TaxID=3064385 RepID=UPI00273E6ED0|nr:DUF3137 domain-containing protein [Aurantiacibacter sp. 219JJ12-13]MDP5262256.1 DUF3137 domain-containing protein [Aurantiacibacter sp. 219JJ12-13]